MAKTRGPKIRVLVVDDEAYVREYHKRILESLGCEVWVAESEEAATRWLHLQARGVVEVVFTDLRMGSLLAGVRLGREVKRYDSNIKVVLVATHLNVGDLFQFDAEIPKGGDEKYIRSEFQEILRQVRK